MKVKDMTMETKGIEIKNKGILLFGIILLVIGLVASFYAQVTIEPMWRYPLSGEPYIYEYVETSRKYPYQGIGIVLVLAGIIFIALGFFYSPRKQEPTMQST